MGQRIKDSSDRLVEPEIVSVLVDPLHFAVSFAFVTIKIYIPKISSAIVFKISHCKTFGIRYKMKYQYLY